MQEMDYLKIHASLSGKRQALRLDSGIVLRAETQKTASTKKPAQGGLILKPDTEKSPLAHLTGAGDRNRTCDLRVTSALLYRLSYTGV